MNGTFVLIDILRENATPNFPVQLRNDEVISSLVKSQTLKTFHLFLLITYSLIALFFMKPKNG